MVYLRSVQNIDCMINAYKAQNGFNLGPIGSSF